MRQQKFSERFVAPKTQAIQLNAVKALTKPIGFMHFFTAKVTTFSAKPVNLMPKL